MEKHSQDFLDNKITLGNVAFKSQGIKDYFNPGGIPVYSPKDGQYNLEYFLNNLQVKSGASEDLGQFMIRKAIETESYYGGDAQSFKAQKWLSAKKNFFG